MFGTNSIRNEYLMSSLISLTRLVASSWATIFSAAMDFHTHRPHSRDAGVRQNDGRYLVQRVESMGGLEAALSASVRWVHPGHTRLAVASDTRPPRCIER